MFFRPDGDAKAAVLIVPAMGVDQSYYASFASWLAAQGCFVATFDYFGTGRSSITDMRKVNVTIIDWARFDCDAMVNAVSSEAPGKRLYCVGHSLGGYFPGRRLREVGDLPRGVMDQWRRWCIDPEYAIGAEGVQARACFADSKSRFGQVTCCQNWPDELSVKRRQ